MNWTFVVLAVGFIGLKWVIFLLIKQRSAKIASWAIFLIVFVFSGFFIVYASIKTDEAEKLAVNLKKAEYEVDANAEEAAKLAQHCSEMIEELQAQMESAYAEAQTQHQRAEEALAKLSECSN